jgi:hypothetical protein
MLEQQSRLGGRLAEPYTAALHRQGLRASQQKAKTGAAYRRYN